jgi:hypothetical protein
MFRYIVDLERIVRRSGVAIAPKIYDFSLPKVEEKLVSFLKTRRAESTVADMIAGTGLPKYQVEVAAKAALDEYAGRLKATESGELLYYFPGGMRSTKRGLGPSARRFWKAFSRGAVRVLSFLFKIWIVAMLVGYFIAFLALAVAAMLAAVAASVAGSRDDRGRDRGGGLGGMTLVVRVFEFMLRMWFWSSLLSGPNAGYGRRPARPPREGRAFYKSVFGFVFGEDDPNAGWEEAERRYLLSYIRGHKGVITLEELMAITGRESTEANQLINRLLLEYEGEPGVTDNGTVVYSFPEVMRTSDAGRAPAGTVPLENPSTKRLLPFSANKKKTNGWIIFFNVVNLAFGAYFLGISLAEGAAAIVKNGPMLYSFTGRLLAQAGMGNPVPFLAIVLGIVPVAFSVLFFLVPLLRKLRLNRQNAKIREEELRKRVYARVLTAPARVSPSDIEPERSELDPPDLPAARRRIIERLAAEQRAEPLEQGPGGAFAWRFAELERQQQDLAQFRSGIDVKKYAVGKTVFDSGE